jgi:hypothetical protein
LFAAALSSACSRISAAGIVSALVSGLAGIGDSSFGNLVNLTDGILQAACQA